MKKKRKFPQLKFSRKKVKYEKVNKNIQKQKKNFGKKVKYDVHIFFCQILCFHNASSQSRFLMKKSSVTKNQ